METKQEIAERISYTAAQMTEKSRQNFVDRLVKASDDFFEYMYKLHSGGGSITKVNNLYLIS
jgi:hypothetical protein